MSVILDSLGQLLKQARLTARFTQDELAERIGVTGRYIMALENEKKTPSFEPTHVKWTLNKKTSNRMI